MHSPSGLSFVAHLDVRDIGAAQRIADGLTETLDPDRTAVALFERPDGGWTVQAHFEAAPEESALRNLVDTISGAEAARALHFETVQKQDWVAASLADLKPVRAGRFIVHGRHDRGRVPPNAIGIEIEAALAFGTGHHGTTRGCLLALEAVMKRQKRRKRPRALSSPPPLRGRSTGAGWPALVGRGVHRTLGRKSPPSPTLPLKGGGSAPHVRHRIRQNHQGKKRTLDVGTGTGVLAIAAAKALRCRVLASDIDSAAITVARANAWANGAGPLIAFIPAAGVDRRRFRERGRYDLIFANILLGPLKGLARPIARLLAPRGRVILSGLLAAQANAALSAYRAQGLRLEHRMTLEGWTTLVLVSG